MLKNIERFRNQISSNENYVSSEPGQIININFEYFHDMKNELMRLRSKVDLICETDTGNVLKNKLKEIRDIISRLEKDYIESII